MGKAWERHKGGKRKNRRTQRTAFHILCKGQNTEPDYFSRFPLSNISTFCKGFGRSKTALVKTAVKCKKRNEIKKGSPDQVWVVFDFDKKGDILAEQKRDYNQAIQMAKKNNIHIAISNDSFELWYLLHFQSCNPQQMRDWYNDKLTERIGFKYDKDKSVSLRMYDLLKEHQLTAIKNAEKLEKEYSPNDPHHADKNPYTTVHHLVKELSNYIDS